MGVTGRGAEATPEVTLAVTGMSCGHCAKAVTDALQSVPGVIRVDVSLEEGTATMEVDDATYAARAAREAVAAAGYTAE